MSVPAVALTTVSTWRQAASIAWRWARTYSRLRGVWKPLGFLGYPGVWLVNVVMIGRRAADTVVSGSAAAIVPNPVTRPSRRLWSALLFPPLALAALILSLSSAPATTTTAAVVAGFAAGGLVIALVWGMLIEVFWSALIQISAASGLHQNVRQLEKATGRPVVVGAMLGAWPQRTGAGGALLEQILAELSASGVSMVGVARNDALAAKYVSKYHAQILDPAHPNLVAWVAYRPSCDR